MTTQYQRYSLFDRLLKHLWAYYFHRNTLYKIKQALEVGLKFIGS